MLWIVSALFEGNFKINEHDEKRRPFCGKRVRLTSRESEQGSI
jgi:hypothetical protein